LAEDRQLGHDKIYVDYFFWKPGVWWEII
jgi:hypothetical protein